MRLHKYRPAVRLPIGMNGGRRGRGGDSGRGRCNGGPGHARIGPGPRPAAASPLPLRRRARRTRRGRPVARGAAALPAPVSLPRVRTGREFVECLEGWLRPAPGARPAGLVSFVLESDSPIRLRDRLHRAEWDVADTGLDHVKIMSVKLDGGNGPACQFFLDVSDKRLPTLHASAGAGDAGRVVGALVDEVHGTLDNMWLHRRMLERIVRDARGGRAGPGARRAGGAGGGGAQVDIASAGCFASGEGGSARDHLDVVDASRRIYSRAVSGVEACLLGPDAGCGGGKGGSTYVGAQVLNLALPGTMGDAGRLVDTMFDCARPFRMGGIKSVVEPGYYRVLAVDMHSGGPMTFEIAAGMMRIYLSQGSCGNTIMRVLANLQSLYGAGVACGEVERLGG